MNDNSLYEVSRNFWSQSVCNAVCFQFKTAAFDTVDHDVLFQRLKNRIGIDGVALNWFCINDGISEAAPLTYGLSQGSCVGPGLFPIYTLPLGDIIKRHNLEYHCYADDTQIYLSIDPELQADVDVALQRIENCIDDVRTWMNQNFLKLNDSKTEIHGSWIESANWEGRHALSILE